MSGDPIPLGAPIAPVPLFQDGDPRGLEPIPDLSHLPPSASWESGLPDIRDQYDDSSCGSWASAYYALTAMTVYRDRGVVPTSPPNPEVQFLVRDHDVRGGHVFSPSFVFNKLDAKPSLWTPSAASALRFIQERGAVKWYWHKAYVGQPIPKPKPGVDKEALRHRLKDFGLIEVPTDPLWLKKVKWWLANRSPVLFDIYVKESFFNHKPKKAPIKDITGAYLDTHNIACVGYDDSKDGGCLRFANTWGTQWAERGLAWVRYDAARKLCGPGQRAWGLRLP